MTKNSVKKQKHSEKKKKIARDRHQALRYEVEKAHYFAIHRVLKRSAKEREEELTKVEQKEQERDIHLIEVLGAWLANDVIRLPKQEVGFLFLRHTANNFFIIVKNFEQKIIVSRTHGTLDKMKRSNEVILEGSLREVGEEISKRGYKYLLVFLMNFGKEKEKIASTFVASGLRPVFVQDRLFTGHNGCRFSVRRRK